MLRFNVLILILFSYGLLPLIFCRSVQLGTPPEESYEFLKEPIMAMIGGTLAIAKDVIPAGSRAAPSRNRAGSAGRAAD